MPAQCNVCVLVCCFVAPYSSAATCDGEGDHGEARSWYLGEPSVCRSCSSEYPLAFTLLTACPAPASSASSPNCVFRWLSQFAPDRGVADAPSSPGRVVVEGDSKAEAATPLGAGSGVHVRDSCI
jgi:hypothetical protein